MQIEVRFHCDYATGLPSCSSLSFTLQSPKIHLDNQSLSMCDDIVYSH